MDQPDAVSAPPQAADPMLDYELPPGDHPLEVAGRRGIGPLSPRGRDVWHGGAVPCVSCGQLVLRDQAECDHCGQDLGREMIERMRAHAGPWYVLEHVRPFPGVSLERIIRQIRRGVLTDTSIVRGPDTEYQWRFAVETPGLCLYFKRCWRCHAEASPTDRQCASCQARLTFKTAAAPPGDSNLQRAGDGRVAEVPATPELAALTAVVDAQPTSTAREAASRPAGPPTLWVAVTVLTITLVGVLLLASWRGRALAPPPAATPTQAPAGR